MEIKTKVIEVVGEFLDIDVNEITGDSKLKEDLNADSLDFVELVMELEEEFDFEANEEELATIVTIDDIVAYIPEYAYSAATFISLATSAIYVNKLTLISPCDPQITVTVGDRDMTYSSSVLIEYIDICRNNKSKYTIIFRSFIWFI